MKCTAKKYNRFKAGFPLKVFYFNKSAPNDQKPDQANFLNLNVFVICETSPAGMPFPEK